MIGVSKFGYNPDTMAHTYNLRTQEVKTGGWRTQPELHSRAYAKKKKRGRVRGGRQDSIVVITHDVW